MPVKTSMELVGKNKIPGSGWRLRYNFDDLFMLKYNRDCFSMNTNMSIRNYLWEDIQTLNKYLREEMPSQLTYMLRYLAWQLFCFSWGVVHRVPALFAWW